ncbi:triacylglycerol lipase [Acinetobacter sp. 194]|uniref:esterase/lipase family protein n=1 Tax=Acinetobacter shaoyimingii TaxID=2715164 RepID=UPI001409B56D|nr:triacylglycerol lipase [Acinetobacter shaoyimingii]
MKTVMKKIKTATFIGATLLATGLSSDVQAAAGILQIKETVKSDYAKTQYPIVMTHGWLGWSRIGNDSFNIDYWYQILPDMARNGSTVFAAQISPAHTTTFRGEQLIQQVEEVIALTGKSKVNLVGHSHGGPTVQYVAAVKPQYVASVTGVGGTYRGSKVADKIQSNTASRTLLNILGDYIVPPLIAWAEGRPDMPLSFDASMTSLTEVESAKFNAKYPTTALANDCKKSGTKVDRGIYYYSWGGVAQTTNLLDIDTILMQLGPLAYGNKDNDGMVARCSTHIGQVIRDNYNLNHTDLANMMFGLKGILAPDPVALFRQHANRLKLQGL